MNENLSKAEKERLRDDIRRYKSLSLMTSDAAATRVMDALIAEAEARLAVLEGEFPPRIADRAEARAAAGR